MPSPRRTPAWTALLTGARLSKRVDDNRDRRSPFQRDFDRIIFSASFRRLADKTQVFPIPVDDHIRSRLTHSLEAATIGRSLGTGLGDILDAQGLLPEGITPAHVGESVSAACLAHDLGNPPFGHAGEKAIREFFSDRRLAPWFRGLKATTRGDLLCFEGNAQAFALTTRIERASKEHGLNLTLMTLGALLKYPCAGSAVRENGAVHRRKPGFLSQDAPTIRQIARALGLHQDPGGQAAWSRHPLAFLTELADDLAYRLLDLEDGLRLGLVSRREFRKLILSVCGRSKGADRRDMEGMSRQEMLSVSGHNRAIAVGTLIQDALTVMASDIQRLARGSRKAPLLEGMKSYAQLKAIETANVEKSYQSHDVLQMEIAGAAALKGVLERLVAAALGGRDVTSDRLRSLMPETLSVDGRSNDDRVRVVVDHVAGMTDGRVLRLFRELNGIRLPGQRD